MTTFVFFLHVLFAAIWVGGNVALQIVGTRIANSGQPDRMPAMAADFEFIGMRVFTPASLLLVISGIWLVATSNGEFHFSQFWVWSSLVAFAYSFATGAFYLTPKLKKAKRVWAEEGGASEAGAQIMRGLFIFSRIELAILVLIVYDMVAKPFS